MTDNISFEEHICWNISCLSVKMQSENLLKKDHGPLGWGEEDQAETISGRGLATNEVLFLHTFLG